jgi:hypothetical protein
LLARHKSTGVEDGAVHVASLSETADVTSGDEPRPAARRPRRRVHRRTPQSSP